MSVRTLLEDAAYRGGAAIASLRSAWGEASRGARAAVLVLLLVVLLLLWLGPRLGLYGDRPGGFTEEELRLMEGAGSGEGSLDELPWWYREDE